MGFYSNKIIIASIIGSILWLTLTTVTRAELTIEETQKLLEESLTISEIDREITRLSQEELKIAELIVETEKSIVVQEQLVDQARVHAGKILRSLYMGERDGLWLLLLNSQSFSDAVVVYQYLRSIVESDQRTLQKHQNAFQELKALIQSLALTQSELRVLKAQFIAQRIRVVQLQEQLDSKLSLLDNDNKEQILTQIDKLSKAWIKDGLPLFQQFLQAMSEAMLELPEYIAENEGSLEQDGSQFTFHIKENQLNSFLRSKNPIFEHFVYSITKEHITIKGTKDQVDITINGHYAIENKPENALRFTLDELIYNDFILPDTTRNDMQKQFSMTFYPKRFSGSLEATAVSQDTGELLIELSISR